MSKEAMKLALEALKELVAQTETGLFAVRHDHVAMNDARQAITALREALAEQPAQQEPVACRCRWDAEGDRVATCERHEGWLEVIAEWAERARDAEKKLKALNTSPQAQRKPLTDAEIKDIRVACGSPLAIHIEFARAIEAAHGIKENT